MTIKNDAKNDDPIDQMRQELSSENKKLHAGKTQRAHKSKARKVIENVLFAVAVIVLSVILASVLVTRANGKTPQVLGYQLYRIESGSMEPTLGVGSLILSHSPENASGLEKDDIITFISSDNKTITHRIVEVVTSEDGSVSYRTKGDNPINSPDNDLVLPQNVEAVFVLKIPLT